MIARLAVIQCQSERALRNCCISRLPCKRHKERRLN
jgi:hypothetical protein